MSKFQIVVSVNYPINQNTFNEDLETDIAVIH